ncbi:hypothetical protein [Nonomuraea sp. NPDC049400]|uniref:hypothetical protein n=1 Tax=Nonomuraea sp. NPDC049400 TaxID=3364352 RepID=UPI0037A598A2
MEPQRTLVLPSPPPKSNNALIIGLVTGLAVLLLGGGGVGAFLYLRSSGSEPTTVTLPSADPFPTTTTTSPSPSDSPSASASASPSDPSASEPAEPTPSDTPPSSRRVDPGSPLTAGEFSDWDFKLGDVELQADKVGGWTYNSCDPVDGRGVLAQNDCQRAVQLAYSADGGHIKAVQIMMSFPSEQAAKKTADRLASLDSDAVKWRKDKAHSNYAYGKIRTGHAKQYVVVTVLTADKSAKSRAARYHSYLQSDHASYFLFRDLSTPN